MKFLTLQPKRLKLTFWFVFFRMMKEVIKFKLSKILRIVVPWSSNNSKSHSKYWKSNKGPTIKAFPNFDGWTNMNLKFLREVSKKREESLFHKLIDIGTCSLILYTRLWKPASKIQLGISKPTENWFPNPAQQPSMTRRLWKCLGVKKIYVENEQVSDWIIEVWSNSFWEGLSKSKKSSCNRCKRIQV